MEFFNWFDLSPALNIDEKALQKAYYTRSKAYHPDFFTGSPIEEQEKMEALSAFNTRAYTALSHLESRIAYILTQSGKIVEGRQMALPPDFLMDMMELNERTEEALATQDADELAVINKYVAQATEDNLISIKPIMDKGLVDSYTEADWEALSLYYYKSKYLARIHQHIEKGPADSAQDL